MSAPRRLVTAAASESIFTRFAGLRRCAGCGGVLEASAGPVHCTRCDRIAIVPPLVEWPEPLAHWLALRSVRPRFQPWYAEQEVWEQLLVDEFRGVRSGPHANPWGPQYTMATASSEVYPLALQLAHAWDVAGRPLALGLATPKQLRASLTLPSPLEDPAV